MCQNVKKMSNKTAGLWRRFTKKNTDQHCVVPPELVCIWPDVQKVFSYLNMKEF